MNNYHFTIYGELPDYNTAITKAKAGNVRKGGGFANPYQTWKQQVDDRIAWEAKSQLKGVKIAGRCAVVIRWYMVNRKKDPDNIAHAAKYIFDGLQAAGVLPNDGWKNVGGGLLHQFAVDPHTPRVEVYLLPGSTLDIEI